MSDEKKDPKVVAVEVKEDKGLLHDFKATVTTDKGKAATGDGLTKTAAIESASASAISKSK